MNLLDDYDVHYGLLLNTTEGETGGYSDSEHHYLQAVAEAKDPDTLPNFVMGGVQVASDCIDAHIIDMCKSIVRARLLNDIATERFGPNAADWPHEQMSYE